MNIFKAYDIRGVYGKDITDEIALDLGKSLGTFLKGKGNVCVGFDTRPSSINLFKNFVSGLTSTGCNVISLGMVPNPLAYFYSWKNKIFGCYVTASHNPVDWNGFKLIRPNGTTFIDEYKNLESILHSKKFISSKKGEIVEEKNASKEYCNFLESKLGKLKGKIVTDFLGGASVKSLEVLNKFGLEVIPLHEKPDASLYGFHRLESWGDLLNTAIETVKKEKADFGVAFDADADRSIFINSAGEYMDPSIMHGIFTKNVLKEKKGKIIATFDSATELEELSKDNGGKLIWSRIGHNFIEQKILDENALFAGEQSSHYYFSDFYPFSDGVLSTLILCKILKETKSFDNLIKEIKFHPVVKLYIEAGTDEKKVEIVENLRKKYPDSVDIADGFKFKLNEVEWVIIRGSQTLPEINLCIEALNEGRMKELVQKYSDIIKKEL